MSKNIVLCSDGTGNTPGKGRGTNVWKIYLAVDRHGHEAGQAAEGASRQIAFYDDGVGTQGNRLLRLIGGAFGWGLSRNILRLYEYLVLNYQQGDKVFLFGFSRGAFTVRSLAGTVLRCGLIPRDAYLAKGIRERKALLKEVLKAYRSDKEDAEEDIRDRLGTEQVDIDFIGVWDTVAAVGLPFGIMESIDGLWRKLFHVRLWGFHDRRLHTRVRKACHALSIDDERKTFHPNVWESVDERIEQVWFPGVHSNVGGGYPKEGVASIALYWMMRQAEGAKLRFVEDSVKEAHDRANAYGKVYDSRSGAAFYYRYDPRRIEELCNGSSSESENANVKVHVTVLDRLDSAADGYAPCNLPASFTVVDPDARSKLGVQKRILEHQARVDASAEHRRAQAAKACRLVGRRRRLYYAFLGLNLFTVGVLVSLAWVEPLEHALRRVGDGLHPLLGWASPAVSYIVGLASSTASVLLPELLARLLQLLASIPELLIVLVLIAMVLTRRRRAVRRQFQEHAEWMWRPELSMPVTRMQRSTPTAAASKSTT